MIQHLSLQEKLDCELERLMTILNIDKNLALDGFLIRNQSYQEK
jgi:hypothetical protein